MGAGGGVEPTILNVMSVVCRPYTNLHKMVGAAGNAPALAFGSTCSQGRWVHFFPTPRYRLAELKQVAVVPRSQVVQRLYSTCFELSYKSSCCRHDITTKWRRAVDLHHSPVGPRGLANRPGTLVRFTLHTKTLPTRGDPTQQPVSITSAGTGVEDSAVRLPPVAKFGHGGRTCTDTKELPPPDFKSSASAYSATPRKVGQGFHWDDRSRFSFRLLVPLHAGFHEVSNLPTSVYLARWS